MADVIAIADLELFCRVGVTEAERAQAQRLLVSVEMEADFRVAAATDDLSATIDYQAVAQRLEHFCHDRQWRLIETLAVDIARLLQTEFGTQRATVEVKKFALPQARWVSARVTR